MKRISYALAGHGQTLELGEAYLWSDVIWVVVAHEGSNYTLLELGLGDDDAVELFENPDTFKYDVWEGP